MTLLEARVLFTYHLGELFYYANSFGVKFMLCESMRSHLQAEWNATHCQVVIDGKRCERGETDHVTLPHNFKAIGILNSVHCLGLAVDILVVSKGGAIVNDPAPYKMLGDYWKGLHPLLRWGGDFKDLGHYSLEWQGRK